MRFQNERKHLPNSVIILNYKLTYIECIIYLLYLLVLCTVTGSNYTYILFIDKPYLQI